MIMVGPEVPAGVVCREPVSLVDCHPTIIDCVGRGADADDAALPGAPLLEVARAGCRSGPSLANITPQVPPLAPS